jgi:hypothetical protein
VKKGAGFAFYGKLFKAIPSGDLDKVTDAKPVGIAGKAKIFFRPYAAPVESPMPTTTCGSPPAACWSTGIPAP